MKYHEKKSFRPPSSYPSLQNGSGRRQRYRGFLGQKRNWRTVHYCRSHVRTCAGSWPAATVQSGRLVKAWSLTTGFRPLHVPFSCDIACPSTSQKSGGTGSSTAVNQGLLVLADLLVWRYSFQRFRPFGPPSQLVSLYWASQSWTSRQRLASRASP